MHKIIFFFPVEDLIKKLLLQISIAAAASGNSPTSCTLSASFFRTRQHSHFHHWQHERLCPERFEPDDDDIFAKDELFNPQPYVRQEPKIGRNDPCLWGSGKKEAKL